MVLVGRVETQQAITEMNKGGGVCPCEGRVCQSSCLNSVKTFGQGRLQPSKQCSMTRTTHICFRPANKD